MQPDSLIPDPSNPQALNRFSYVINNPINLNDPSGNKWACTGANDDHCYDDGEGQINGPLLDTYTKAAIEMEAGWQSRILHNLRYAFSDEKAFDSIGPAQISDIEMETPYGVEIEGGRKTGLGLREGSCDFGCEMDQTDLDVAKLAMRTKLTLRLNVCVQNGCTHTDMFMVALIAADERISPNQLKVAFKDPVLKSSDPRVTIDWANFLPQNWPSDNWKNIQLINLFSKSVQDMQSQNYYVPPINWEYISTLTGTKP